MGLEIGVEASTPPTKIEKLQSTNSKQTPTLGTPALS